MADLIVLQKWDCWDGLCWCLILGFVVATILRFGYGIVCTPKSQGEASRRNVVFIVTGAKPSCRRSGESGTKAEDL
jgi:hypothetical protein